MCRFVYMRTSSASGGDSALPKPRKADLLSWSRGSIFVRWCAGCLLRPFATMSMPTSAATLEGDAAFEGKIGWIGSVSELGPSSTPETETSLPPVVGMVAADGAPDSGALDLDGLRSCRRFVLSALCAASACFLSLLWFLQSHEQQVAGRSASCFLYSALCSAEIYMKTRDLSVE